MKISELTTAELVEELEKREGVKVASVGPEGEVSVDIDDEAEPIDTTHWIDGPTKIVIITD
ncbi:BC1881 family protein [Natroniella sp. ANB-PHB2]|uniref:BC1881 family protein n=1 Tax=Natroniella sp. ANB-PHB2 TaxID=3384444 RepID=UPI0038D4978C